MARIFDVIENPSEMRNEMVRRFPESGTGDFRIGSQVIVRESQAAVFFNSGRALDTFGPGRHTITTANVPVLIDWLGKAFNDRTPFPAEVYFVSMRDFPDQKWGTPQPILVRSGMGLGATFLQAFGSYSFAIEDPQRFVNQIVGQQGAYSTADIQGRLRAIILSKLADILGEMTKTRSLLDLIALTEEIGAGVRAKCQDDFKAIGLILKAFYAESIRPSNKSAEELRASGLLDTQTYMQLQAADAMREAAQNEGGGASLTAGIGAGLGIGQIMGQAFTGGAQPPAAAAPAGAPAGPAGPAGGVAAAEIPSVMTAEQAASYLQVTVEDVNAMVTGGEIKARQLPSGVRISKQALDEWLAGG